MLKGFGHAKACQLRAFCSVQDYPEPIVDHKEASSKCKDRMQQAYAENKKRKRGD